MKKFILFITLSAGLFGCSSLELETVSTSAEETQRILAMGLSHEENLIEAKKLKSDLMISVVTLQLTNAKDEKIQAEIDKVESNKFSDLVNVSESGLKFIGAEISESLATILSTGLDLQEYHLKGEKNSNSGIISHKLNLAFIHKSGSSRNYISANLCDEWGRCDGNNQEINVISENATNCTSNSCQYREVLELNLSDDFLRNSADSGFTMRINSKRKTNKVKISKAYLMGYLKIAQ